ncbi:MAG: hypothetical protein HOQ34_07840 [Gemmatimonadaceae bacterium]|nr:hypothetical protein [Gemmatimonadaceae bacterium]
MAPSIPTTEPDTIVAGDTWQWDRAVADYAPADGWSLSYDVAGPQAFSITGADVTTVGSSFRVTYKSSSALPEGTYQWFARVTSATQGRRTVDRGTFTILADTPAQLHAEKMLAAIEAVIENRIPADVESYTIGGRSIVKMSSEELRRWRGYYAAEVRRARSGGQVFSPVRVSFCG